DDSRPAHVRTAVFRLRPTFPGGAWQSSRPPKKETLYAFCGMRSRTPRLLATQPDRCGAEPADRVARAGQPHVGTRVLHAFGADGLPGDPRGLASPANRAPDARGGHHLAAPGGGLEPGDVSRHPPTAPP